MARFVSRDVRRTALCSVLFLVLPTVAAAQADAITGLLGNATDFDFFWTQAGTPRSELKPDRPAGAAGVGFELAFDIPGGITRKRTVPRSKSSQPEGRDCEARFARGELRQDATCADTTVVSVKRSRTAGVITYEEELKVAEFDWESPLVTFEFAIGFSQTGAYVSRGTSSDIRVSLREAPSVSLYANYEPGLRLLGLSLAAYVGARSGLVSLVGGRAVTDEATTNFAGETLQIGPVAGLVTDLRGMNLFVEGAYMWRDFKSLEWDSTATNPILPQALNLSGASLSVGVQFKFRQPEGK